MNDRHWDIAIIGAGPAGAAAARELAGHGLSVVLLERAEWPRDKPCGGGITGRALGELPPGLSLPVEQRCHQVELNLLDAHLSFRERQAQPLVTMVMRRDFDAALVALAIECGACLIDGCQVTGLEPGIAGVAIATTRGPLRARLAILADGAFSPSARLVGWPDGRRMMAALEWEVPVDSATLQRFDDTARFDFGLAADGYAWIFPKARHLSVGIGVLDAQGRQLSRLLHEHLEQLAIRPTAPVLRQGHIIPVRPRRAPLAGQRLLLTGDAAGLADPLTGEGLTFALCSGRLAAAAIVAGRLDPSAVAARYQRALEEEILPEIFYGSLLATLIYRFPAWRRRLFRQRGGQLSRRMLAVISGQTTYREIFSRLPAWWRLLVPVNTKAR